MANSIIVWNKLQLGRYIRAVTGHNNLLYHLHNIDNDISPICRFCLEDNEEFRHLIFDCPALWFERHTINSQVPDHSTPESWSPIQIVDFTFFPKINDAFAKPLYRMDQAQDAEVGVPPSTSQPDNPDDPIHSDTDTDVSVMEVSSMSDSSSQENLSSDSDVSIISI